MVERASQFRSMRQLPPTAFSVRHIPAAFSIDAKGAAACAIARHVENPQDCFEHARRRNRFASRTTIRNVFLRKMIPNALPMLVAEPNHPTFIADRARSMI